MWSKAQIFEALGPAGQLLPDVSAPFDGWRAAQLDDVRRRALEWLERPAPPLPYSLFRLYAETGDRARFQAPYYERRGRLLVFALLCRFEPEDPRWLPALEDAIWDLCAEPFWCLPAHLLDVGDRPLAFERWDGNLDLFACETAFALAETLVLCESRLDPVVAAQARAQIERRVLTPFCRADLIHRFETMHNNWCAVCAGAVGGTALHLVEDRARLSEIVCRCLSSMQSYLDSFGDDGVCVEGVGYWTYGFGFFTCFADLLSKRTGGACDLFALPKVRAIALCQQHYFLSGGCTASFADGGMRGGYCMGLSCRLQEIYPECAIPDEAFADGVLNDTCYRFCLSLRDFLWYRPSARFGLPEQRCVWLPDAQWLIASGPDLALAAKAGTNGESHNHNDCGSFLICRGGKQLICDFGAAQYDAESFGPRRYERFVHASRGHNVAMPAGCEQLAGAQYAAREVEADCRAGRLSMELSGCYDCPPLKRYDRVIEYSADAGRVTVRDKLEFSRPETCCEVFVSPFPIRLEPGRAVFSSGTSQAVLSFDESLLAPELLTETYLEHNTGEERTAYILHLNTQAASRHTLEFVIV